jgi:hypothetical protein
MSSFSRGHSLGWWWGWCKLERSYVQDGKLWLDFRTNRRDLRYRLLCLWLLVSRMQVHVTVLFPAWPGHARRGVAFYLWGWWL